MTRLIFRHPSLMNPSLTQQQGTGVTANTGQIHTLPPTQLGNTRVDGIINDRYALPSVEHKNPIDNTIPPLTHALFQGRFNPEVDVLSADEQERPADAFNGTQHEDDNRGAVGFGVSSQGLTAHVNTKNEKPETVQAMPAEGRMQKIGRIRSLCLKK